MNITEIARGRQVITQVHEPDCVWEFPARYVNAWETPDGHVALFAHRDGGVWRNMVARATTRLGPWVQAGTGHGLTFRPERVETIASVAENIAWDGAATDDLIQKVIAVLRMDPACVDGDTPVGEEQAEKAYNEIGYNL